MSNSISFTGRLGQDPELKQAGQNDVLEFNVGNSVGWGEKKVTNWFKCSVWGNRAVSLNQNLTKGKEVFVTGQLTLREYTKRDGTKGTSAEVKVAEVEFIGGKKEEGGGGGGAYESSAPRSAPRQAAQTPETSDDLPF